MPLLISVSCTSWSLISALLALLAASFFVLSTCFSDFLTLPSVLLLPFDASDLGTPLLSHFSCHLSQAILWTRFLSSGVCFLLRGLALAEALRLALAFAEALDLALPWRSFTAGAFGGMGSCVLVVPSSAKSSRRRVSCESGISGFSLSPMSLSQRRGVGPKGLP